MNDFTLPKWPPLSNAFFFDSAREVFEEFRIFNLPVAGSLGMVTQAEAESWFKIDAKGDKVNGQPTAFGLFQWHATRAIAIKANTGIDILTFPSIKDQCAAAIWELKTFPILGLAQLRAASTAMQGGMVGCQFFERAGAANAIRRRGAMGERWSAYAAKNKWGN